MCARCNDEIVGEENGLVAMDRMYHVSCFTCTMCGCRLRGMHFYSMENKPYCEPCYIVSRRSSSPSSVLLTFHLEFVGKMRRVFATDHRSSNVEERRTNDASHRRSFRFFVQRANRFMLNAFAASLVKRVSTVFHLLSMLTCKFIVSIVFIRNSLRAASPAIGPFCPTLVKRKQ